MPQYITENHWKIVANFLSYKATHVKDSQKMTNRRQSAITGGAEARFTDRLLAKQPSGSQQGQGRQCNLRWNSFPKANRTLNRKGQKKYVEG